MKKQLLAVLIGATALAAVPAMAAGDMYAGLSLGQSMWDPDLDTSGASEDDSDTYFGIFGGYKFSENFAVELSYNDFGEYSASGGGAKYTEDATSIGVAAVGSYPFGNGFGILGKIGFEMWDSDAKASFGGSSASESDDGTDLFYGIGVSYDMTEAATASLEYQLHSFEPDYGGDKVDTDLDVIAVSFSFGF